MNAAAQHLAPHVAAFPRARVLCLGDIMLDRYVYGSVERVSAEAPIQILAHRSERTMLGGAGNVARNVAALGGRATVVAVVGDDDGGKEIARLIAEEPNLEGDLLAVPGRCTTLKVRYVARGHQLLRADREETGALDERSRSRLVEAYTYALRNADVVLLSDYAKGCLGDDVLRTVIHRAQEAGKPLIVDPKGADFARYAGVSVIKPNARELELTTGMPCSDDASAESAARRALALADVGAVLVTRSDQGLTLVQRRGGPAQHFRERSSEVYDVSGAGDTALAVLGLCVAVGAPLEDAARLANKACGIVISKVGTAVVYARELMQALRSAEFEHAGEKVVPEVLLLDHVGRWRAKRLRVGFTNGCFDLVHAGHVELLARARAACDRLIVGLNSDASVRRLKGPGRPINSEMARAIVLASFSATDAVVVFEEDTPLRLIESVRPDVLIKGADYTEDQVVGAELVRSYGGDVVLVELAPVPSTTQTIGRIRG